MRTFNEKSYKQFNTKMSMVREKLLESQHNIEQLPTVDTTAPPTNRSPQPSRSPRQRFPQRSRQRFPQRSRQRSPQRSPQRSLPKKKTSGISPRIFSSVSSLPKLRPQPPQFDFKSKLSNI
jgi:hypothetical protein